MRARLKAVIDCAKYEPQRKLYKQFIKASHKSYLQKYDQTKALVEYNCLIHGLPNCKEEIREHNNLPSLQNTQAHLS